MKFLHKTIVFLFAWILLAGCAEKYDDSALSGKVDNLEERVSELERLVADLTTNVQNVSTIVKTLESEDRIKDVVMLEDGSGYIIRFVRKGTDGNDITGEITIKNGKDGEKPVISIQQDEETGIWYWMADGQPLMNGTEKIPAVMTPEFKTEEGKLYFRVNNGEWAVVPGADQGIGIISGIDQTDEDVTFHLSTGGDIVIPKVQGFSIRIDFSEIGASAGSTVQVPYSIIDGDAATVVKVIPDAGYSVTVDGSYLGGNLIITLPTENHDNGSVLVLAINGKGAVTGKLLTFADGTFNVTTVNKTAKVGKAGGIAKLQLETNLPYRIVPKPEIQWVRKIDSPTTKALRKDEILFEVDANDAVDAHERTVTFEIKYGYNYENTETFTIIQSAGGESDFSTFETIGKVTAYVPNGTKTAAGWYVNEYCLILPEGGATNNWDAVNVCIPVLCGLNEQEAGKLSSPNLEGGCGLLKVQYGTSAANSQNVGFSFKVTVSNGIETKSFDVVKQKGEAQRSTTYEAVFNVNLTGNFTVTLQNTVFAPQTGTLYMKDAVCIASVEWSGYSEQ